jgi:putative nucleotidyltransferase with HDIG domain
MSSDTINDILRLIGRTADKHGLTVYAVGGYVRDQVLGTSTQDVDILVLEPGGGLQLADLLYRECRFGRPVLFERFQTAQTRYKGVEIELVAARREVYDPNSRKPVVGRATLEEDIRRRDFTINSLVMALNRDQFGTVLDITSQGQADIAARVVRSIGDARERFDEDPLRMLRAVRFACQLGFAIDPAVIDAIREKKERLTIVSIERVREEFEKILLSLRPALGLEQLHATGLLALIDPELEKMAGFDQEVIYHCHDLLGHTAAMLEQVKKKLVLRLAVLYHDTGKLYTKRSKEDRFVYYNHESKSAEIAAASLKQLKFPNQVVDDVVFLVRNHMINYEEKWGDAAIRRLVHRTGAYLADLLAIRRADILTLAPPYNDPQTILDLERRIRAVNVRQVRKIVSPLDGKQIQELLGIPASKKVGEIKQRLLDAVLAGEIRNSVEEAQELVKKEFGNA